MNFEYTLLRSKRRTLEISVKEDASVVVRAPLKLSVPDIESFVQKKKTWIKKKTQEQLRNIEKKRRNSHDYVAWLGEKKKLIVHHGLFEDVYFSGQTLHVYCSDPTDRKLIDDLVDRWFLKAAKDYLEARFPAVLAKFEEPPIKPRKLTIKRFKSRWGSCAPNGDIILNAELAHCPTHAVDYVIAHEISHLFYLNHKKRFYAVLSKALPDWKIGRKALL